MIHKLHLQKYLSDPVKIKELLLEDNYGEQEYFAIYMGILICLVLLYLFFAYLFLYSYIAYRKRELMLKYVSGYDPDHQAFTYSSINIVPWLFLILANMYFQNWLVPYYAAFAIIEFFVTFIIFKRHFKEQLRSYQW